MTETQGPMGPGGRLPVVFVGHGSPMNAIGDNRWSRAFRALGDTLPRPRAILSISAHWYEAGTLLTAAARPRTIHDFGGFPAELYQLQYPAQGDPALAARVVQLLGEGRAALDTSWGLDHGTWSVLLHMWPAADCPVVQLSLDSRLSAAEHLALGRALAPLRAEGVLIMGSGNITHNLRQAFSSLQRGDQSTPAWASRFDAEVQRAVEQHDAEFLIRALDSSDGRKSHPTPDHFLPLLYAFGATENGESVRFPITGFDLGSLSMRAVVFE